jgi:hypothetical protein
MIEKCGSAEMKKKKSEFRIQNVKSGDWMIGRF